MSQPRPEAGTLAEDEGGDKGVTTGKGVSSFSSDDHPRVWFVGTVTHPG